jgi:alpha-galactosidase
MRTALRQPLALTLGAMGLCLLSSTLHAQEAAALRAMDAPAGALWVDKLNLTNIQQDYGSPHAGKSVDGNPLTLHGVVYPHGIGTHAHSEMLINLRGEATRFVAMVGLDDEKAKSAGSVTFDVLVDGKKVYSSGVMRGGMEPKMVSVDLTGAKKLLLRVGDADDGIDSDHADWAGAMLTLLSGASVGPESMPAPQVPAIPARYVPVTVSPKPAIHGARIVGATPGRPFLFKIAATGEMPMTFTAKNLPTGLKLDPKTGILTGSLTREGRTEVEVTVRNTQGAAVRTLSIVGGDHKLALTPPMGWNSWNCWAGAVDDPKVRAAVDAMLSSGLAAHGFQYINIDDTWEGRRDAEGEIQTNSKFPDMKALADYVHSKGLKLGIYSSPGPKTCAGFEASYKHEDQDAATYAKWGIDYLKHDWCSYGDVVTGEGLDRFEKPYKWMRSALDHTNRDIVFSLCQYGMGDVWKWGDDVGGNCWRTTGDINDSWGSLHGIYTSQNGHEKFAGPGHWNDPDMLVVGKVGWGPSLHPSHLKPNEQLLHISMWCMLSSPLLIGCDMSDMDKFTIDLLSNDEVLDINQDPLGKPAGRVAMTGDLEVWSRPLFDGTTAVALVNSSSEASPIKADWKDIGVTGKQSARDLWMHKNVGTFDGSYSVVVPAHGVVVVKIGKQTK